MNWVNLTLTVFVGGLVASLTDWLFMGDITNTLKFGGTRMVREK